MKVFTEESPQRKKCNFLLGVKMEIFIPCYFSNLSDNLFSLVMFLRYMYASRSTFSFLKCPYKANKISNLNFIKFNNKLQ